MISRLHILNRVVPVWYAAIEVAEYQSNLLADFSSRGPVHDGRLKPDIVAVRSPPRFSEPFVNSAARDGDGAQMTS